MPSELYLAIPGLSTLTDMSTKQFYAVQADTSNALTITAITAVTNRPIGILQDNPLGATGDPVPATVAYMGVTKAVVGTGGWTRGQTLGVSSTGTLIALTEGITASQTLYIIGVALDTALVGEIARMLLLTPYLGSHT